MENDRPPLGLSEVLYLSNRGTDIAGGAPITLTWDGSSWVGRVVLIPAHIFIGKFGQEG